MNTNKPLQSPFIPSGSPRLIIPEESNLPVSASLAMLGVIALLIFGMMLMINNQLTLP